MAESGPTPPCPVCDDCCKSCCTACGNDPCESPDCEFKFIVNPEDLPDITEPVDSFTADCCGPNKAGFDEGCSGVTIEACCQAIKNEGCNDHYCKSVKWTVCNRTNRCIFFTTLFCISGLSNDDGGEACANEDEDCCRLQFKGPGSGECDWTAGFGSEPNGRAPGPGFCIAPCSQVSICQIYRIGNINADACADGCKQYIDSDPSVKDCCEATAMVSTPCGAVCCTDNWNASQGEDEEDPAIEDDCSFFCFGEEEDCPPCCGCCIPDLEFMEGEGWTDITPAPSNDCCTERILETDNTDLWDGFGAEFGCTVDTDCEVNPSGALESECTMDGSNDGCICIYEPVPAAHPGSLPQTEEQGRASGENRRDPHGQSGLWR